MPAISKAGGALGVTWAMGWESGGVPGKWNTGFRLLATMGRKSYGPAMPIQPRSMDGDAPWRSSQRGSSATMAAL
ncbi:hypothetical protein D3C73_1429910 [compost metagenome]